MSGFIFIRIQGESWFNDPTALNATTAMQSWCHYVDFLGIFSLSLPPRNRHIPSSITSEEWNEFHVHRWVMTFYGKWIEVGACPFCSLYIPSPAWPSEAHIKVQQQPPIGGSRSFFCSQNHQKWENVEMECKERDRKFRAFAWMVFYGAECPFLLL